MAREIKYVKGDATEPVADGNIIIAHICNDIGAWGKGFVLAISKKWRQPEQEYRKWLKEDINFALGEVQFVSVNSFITTANMIGQHGIKSKGVDIPIRYDAVESCLEKVAIKARELNASVHMPRIGCGLAGGKWDMIEKIIEKTLLKNNINVYVYDF